MFMLHSPITSPLQCTFCYSLPLCASLHCMTLLAWPISLHVDSSTSWRDLSDAIWYRNGKLRPQTRIAQLCCISLSSFSFFCCYFYFKDWNATYSSSIVPGNIRVSLKSSISCHGSGTGIGDCVQACWKWNRLRSHAYLTGAFKHFCLITLKIVRPTENVRWASNAFHFAQ
jgi:hypothetical protein